MYVLMLEVSAFIQSRMMLTLAKTVEILLMVQVILVKSITSTRVLTGKPSEEFLLLFISGWRRANRIRNCPDSWF